MPLKMYMVLFNVAHKTHAHFDLNGVNWYEWQLILLDNYFAVLAKKKFIKIIYHFPKPQNTSSHVLNT